jgi:hypothetical protein
MRRLSPFVGIVALIIAFVAAACGGDKPSIVEPTVGPEQHDYLQRAAELVSSLNGDRAANKYPLYYVTPRAGELDAWATAIDQWDQLRPPADLVRVHRELGAHMRRMVNDYQAKRFRQALTLEEPWNRWWNAAEEHYGVLLYQVLDPFMEPTICHDDVLVIPPTDGILDRWQLAVRKRPPYPSEFKPKERPSEILRVAALGGETIQVGPNGVTVNGQLRTDDPYAIEQADYTFGPVTVPDGKYFLLADKRWKAIDSRNSTKEIGAPTFYGPEDLIGELPAGTKGCRFNSPYKDP